MKTRHSRSSGSTVAGSNGNDNTKHGKKFKGKGKPSGPEWVEEPVSEEFFSMKDFDSLISVEVLTDYNIESYKGSRRHAEDSDAEDEEVSKTKRKRKLTDNKKEQSGSTGALEGQVDFETPKSKKHKRNDGKMTNDSVDSTTEWEVYDEDEVDNRRDTSASNKSKRLAQIKIKNKSQSEVSEAPKRKSESFNEEEWSKLGVPDLVLRALEGNGFDNPTPIQKQTLPATILGRKDCVGAAETGSGKTLAFAIPIVSGILRERNTMLHEPTDNRGLKAMILTPTRELAVQIKKHIDDISTYANINAVVIVGGLAPQKQERLLRGKPDIVIATPGRLWELVQNGNEHLSSLHSLKYLAVDETDRMVEKGHFQELQGILAVINSNEDSKGRRQNFVFSATLAFTHEPPQRLKNSKAKRNKKLPKKLSPEDKLNDIMEMIGVSENPKIVDITTGKGTCETLTEMSITCALSQKDYYMYYFFMKHPGRTIVFCNSINCVRRLVNLFFLLQCEPLALHSEMHQKQRLRNLERFAANDKGILIATDVAARGLDIINIEHVIHYQVPKTAESYIHRSGRTARAFKGGLALVIIEPAETTTFNNINRSLGRNEMLPSFEIDSALFNEIKARVNMAIKVESFEHAVRKKCADTNWMEKAKKEMDLASSDEDSDRDIDGKQESKKILQKAKQQLEAAKAELAALLAVNYSLFRKNFISSFKM